MQHQALRKLGVWDRSETRSSGWASERQSHLRTGDLGRWAQISRANQRAPLRLIPDLHLAQDPFPPKLTPPPRTLAPSFVHRRPDTAIASHSRYLARLIGVAIPDRVLAIQLPSGIVATAAPDKGRRRARYFGAVTTLPSARQVPRPVSVFLLTLHRALVCAPC